MKRKYYGIKVGRISNTVVSTWDECSDLVTGHPGCVFKSFPTYDEAAGFAAGDYNPPRSTAETRRKKRLKRLMHSGNKGKCLERKSYKDPVTGIFYKNRCVVRHYTTITGVNYQPSNDHSIPWEVTGAN